MDSPQAVKNDIRHNLRGACAAPVDSAVRGSDRRKHFSRSAERWRGHTRSRGEHLISLKLDGAGIRVLIDVPSEPISPSSTRTTRSRWTNPQAHRADHLIGETRGEQGGVVGVRQPRDQGNVLPPGIPEHTVDVTNHAAPGRARATSRPTSGGRTTAICSSSVIMPRLKKSCAVAPRAPAACGGTGVAKKGKKGRDS